MDVPTSLVNGTRTKKIRLIDRNVRYDQQHQHVCRIEILIRLLLIVWAIDTADVPARAPNSIPLRFERSAFATFNIRSAIELIALSHFNPSAI